MNRLPLWMTIAFAVIIALLIGIICGGIAIPDDYRLLKADTPCPQAQEYDETQTELWEYMQGKGFKPPEDMREIIAAKNLVGWKGVVYRGLDGKERYFVVDYAKKDEACMRWNGNFCCVTLLMSLVFSYEDGRCVAAKWTDDEGKEHQKRYKGKPV